MVVCCEPTVVQEMRTMLQNIVDFRWVVIRADVMRTEGI